MQNQYKKNSKNSIYNVITDTCVKIAVLEICPEKNTRESVVGTLLPYNLITFSEGILGKIGQKGFVTLSRFRLLRGWEVWVNLLEKENL